ncbi:MAG: Rv2231c family pyridoxal phosphate-dependent protein CobC, partial [Nocardioides sp.]|nr:Rv2231c family pyridoxal phosphate-dependent protein CobC [Nocardioides sp.]
ELHDDPWDPVSALSMEPLPTQPVVAMAGGRAFTFRYAETEELLRAAGCEVVIFDPLRDHTLPPDTAGIYLGGGFPEVHAAGLTANESLREDLRAAIDAGIPTVAECAGLLYLCSSVDDAAMIGTLEATAAMSSRLTLSYRRVTAVGDDLLSRQGEEVTGHEFHRTTVSPATGAQGAWLVGDSPVGFATPTLHASYLHTHWAGHPHLAKRFAQAVHRAAPHNGIPLPCPTPEQRTSGSVPDRGSKGDLRHHGDRESGAGLLDFAVNVYDDPRPTWLDDALRASLDDVGAYPDPSGAEVAIARRHGRDPAEVLATAGAAEAFSLIAGASDWGRPVVVHPQFTEPDVALQASGHRVTHVVLDAEDDFTLDPAKIPDDADLVFLGNPTNPTGVLHPAATIRALLRPDRLVVVDEAFLDSVPGETHSFAPTPTPGLVVVRSLTKLWGIPGVRAGYVLAEPGIIDELRWRQVPWSVSATAAAAMVATAGEDARAEAALRTQRIATRRSVLGQGLTDLGIPYVASQAPFVLARPGSGVRERLRAAGYAVRRADTFPGLDESWVRIAVRAPETTRKLLAALRLER